MILTVFSVIVCCVQQWADTTGAPATEWGAAEVTRGDPQAQVGGLVPTGQPSQAPAEAGAGTGTGTGTSAPTGLGDQDWNVGPTTTTKDWGAEEADWSSEPVSAQELKVKRLLIVVFLVPTGCWW